MLIPIIDSNTELNKTNNAIIKVKTLVELRSIFNKMNNKNDS